MPKQSIKARNVSDGKATAKARSVSAGKATVGRALPAAATPDAPPTTPRQKRQRHDYQYTQVVPSRCGKCGSTKRNRYYLTKDRLVGGTDPNGQPFTHIVWRYTSCAEQNCGQHRVDRHYENRV